MKARAILSAIGVWTAACTAMGQQEVSRMVPRQFVVQLAHATDDIFWVAQRYDAAVVGAYPVRGLYLLQTQSVQDDNAIDAAMTKDQSLSSHERNELSFPTDGNTRSFFVRAANAGPYYATPLYGKLGLPVAFQYATGEGVTIAVLDTGVGANDALAGRIADGGYNFVNGNSNVDDAPTGIDSDGNGVADQLVGHGTFVSGLVLLAAPNAKVLPIKVLDSDGVGNTFTMAAGIYYALQQHATVVNMSLSTPYMSSIVGQAVAEARKGGVTIVAAVANDSSDQPSYPAAYPGVISVSAVDDGNDLASFSNYGSYVTVAAPGIDLASVMPDDQFAVASGTSFSSALVSGVAALVQSRVKNITPDALAARLVRTSIPLPFNASTGEAYGHGAISAAAAVLNIGHTGAAQNGAGKN